MPRDNSRDNALRAASWKRVRENFDQLTSNPLVSLVAVVSEGDADPSAFIRELAARENRAHWQGTPIRPVEREPGECEPVPVSHRLFAFGDPKTWESFRVVAMRAGVLATAVPERLLPAGGRDRNSDLGRWAWTLFELGWRKLDTTPFRAEKWVRGEDGGAYQLELARNTGQYGGWYYSEIGDAVRASIDVLEVLAESGPIHPREDSPKIHTIAALREMTNLSNATLNKYAKRANVETPRRGQRNFRYSTADVRTILQEIIGRTAESSVLGASKKALANLKDTAR